ncbi:MAG: alcohol dehydrogenase catalytic domain-containing protein [bacterium]|nr:alcohol dehydrogenase catalytic domain-containing protein [bacterium]
MKNTMKAVVYYAPQDIRVEQIPIPACGDDEVRVTVDACAVCGSDLKAYKHGNPRIKPPLVLGHEFTGIIETIGKSVDGFSLGDRVVMAVAVSCGKCYYCRQGRPNICVEVAVMGFGYPGGMAEYVTIPARAVKNGHVVKVPDDITPEHAALAESVGCVVNSMENCRIQENDTVVVIGAGTMGMINACAAREFGAKKVILVNRSEHRLQRARSFGFDLLVHSETEDVVQRIRDLTDGLGADAVIAAAPAADTQKLALELVRKRGTVCLYASLAPGQHLLSLDSRKIHYGELRVVGTSDCTARQVEKAVSLLANRKIPAEKLVTHCLPLDRVLTAFDLMQRGESLRVVLKP